MQDDSPWRPPADDHDDSDGHDGSDDASELDGGHSAEELNDDALEAPAEAPDVDVPMADVPMADVPMVDVPMADAPMAPTLPPAAPSVPAPPVPPSPGAAETDAAPTLPNSAPQIPTPSPIMPAPAAAEPVATSVTTQPTGTAPWSPGATAPDGDTIVMQSTMPPAGRSKRSKWLVGGAAAAVVAVGAAGVFAISNLTGSVQGGAASPDELGLTLMTAIENEDVLGVIDVLSPGERDVFRDPMVDLVSELTRLEVLSPDADLARILGLDVELSNESVRTEATNVSDIVNIDLSADAVVSLDGAEVPVGALVTDNLPDDMLTELRGTKLTQTEDFEVRLTAVQHEDRWYFSVFHSIAESARDEFDPDALIPAEGIGSDGGDTPEAAFNGLLDSVEALDVTGLLRRLNPGEAAALQRYAPLFVEEAQSLLDEVPLEWEITAREFRVEGDGDTRTVLLDALAIEGTIEDTAFTASFAEGCLRAEADGESFEQCENDTSVADLEEMLADAPDAKRLLDTVTEAFSDMEEVGLEMRRFDGQWYVSPTSTMTEGLLAVLRALDRSEIDAIVDQAPAAFDEFSEAFFGGLNSLPGTIIGMDDDEFVFADDPDDMFSDDVFSDDVFSDDGVIVEGEFTDDGFLDDASADDGFFDDDDAIDVEMDPLEAAWSDCYSETDAALATDCFASVSAAGGPDESLMPLALRFPECGYAISWDPGFYQLSDEEFIGAAEAARTCFLDLVDTGEISEWELPNEISALDCFEGRNWYQVFDDPAYDERYYACIAES